MKKKSIATILICLFWFNIQAQMTPYVSLDSVLIQVEMNYPSILQYQYNIQSLETKTEGSKFWMPPTISTGLMRFPYDLGMINEKNNPMNQAGIGISLEQMIPNPGKLNAKYSYYNSLAEIEKSKYEWTKNELRREAKIIYYNRYITEKKQKVIAESEDILTILLDNVETKFSSNQSQLQTIYKAKARLAELRNMQYMLSGVVAESNIGLNILLVQDVYTAFEIDTLIQPKNYSATIIDTGMITNRSDIIAMTQSIQSMQLEQNAMKIGNRPDFGIRLEHMQMFGMPSQWSVMGMMTIPIAPWSAKMYNSEAKAIGYQIQSMELEVQTMKLMAQRMLAEKLSMLQYEYGQYENYKNDIIPAYENNLQANLLAYKQNTGDFFIVLDAWEMYLMKQIEMHDKLFNILRLEAEYEYEQEIK